ncbi:dyf-1 [Pristionchus pacificus]|uniref:Tetratricopeptide repeat protein 30 n=1 Tax=Pristionchus pacificus TaxID=54126 RepID=A0A2A6BN41_PRIPA|nr:dyf-1 [Pristionchus pacificus]|eukprot:PDM67258.1 dyf-1 [Pristionchus pacificus]
MSFAPIKDGEYTSTIYGLIRDNRYNDVIRISLYEVQKAPSNRAALSLLAYSYYYTQDFPNAAICYEKLASLYPTLPKYRLYHAQALYNAFQLTDALGVIAQIEEQELLPQVIKLEACIKYREEDLRNARILVEQYAEEDADIEMNVACLEYKEGNIDKALERFYAVSNSIGYRPDLSYAIALCHYRRKENNEALKFIVDIVANGHKMHPELEGGSSDGVELRSVGNTLLLHETCLIEACNLKFAIEYDAKNMSKAMEALTDMPPRSEEEWDAVTLHNNALVAVETNPADGFAKLQFLLSQTPFPQEAFGNLLLLYCKYEYIDLAADVLAENAHLTYKYLSPFTFDFIDAMISMVTSPDHAFAKLDGMAAKTLPDLRRLSIKIHGNKSELMEGELPPDQKFQMNKDISEYDEVIERYLAVVMAQCKVCWDRGQYSRIEKILGASLEFLDKNDTYTLNLAHTIYMKGEKYDVAAQFYEPIVNASIDNILEVPAIVLANLCVCYILSNANDEAEMLIRKVEREEERLLFSPDEKVKSFQSCIINLVIGTLYCNKGNYEFGISRVIKAMQPYDRRLGTDTWFYAKRCILFTLEAIAKHVVTVRDSLIDELLLFLEKCEEYGEEVPASIDGPLMEGHLDSMKNTVTYESRQLRALVLEMYDY